MKKILLTISAMLAVITALAQKPDEGANGCFFDTKIREFVYRLELTREQEDSSSFSTSSTAKTCTQL